MMRRKTSKWYIRLRNNARNCQRRFRSRTGFTLVEIMLAAAILSLGLVFIYEVFLISLDAVSFFFNRLNAQHFINEKIWQVQDILDKPAGIFLPNQNQGTFTLHNKDFDWQLEIKSWDAEQELYLVNATVNWNEGQRRKTISRASAIKKYFSNVYPVGESSSP